jgi:two-component system KDP operon response regulator KdpE
VTAAILAVEDEALNQALLQAVLARDPVLRDSRLVLAASVAEGRAAIAATRFDLVILDLRLPDGDGLTLAHELRALPNPPPIMVLTANVQEERSQAAVDAGVDAFIGKPYPPAKLVGEILRLLDARGVSPI